MENPCMIELYQDVSKESGVLAYQLSEHAIAIIFKTEPKEKYIYDYNDPGRKIVEEMIKLARKGAGLASYKNRVARQQRESIKLTRKELKELATLLEKKEKMR
jgi:ribonuclease P protein component